MPHVTQLSQLRATLYRIGSPAGGRVLRAPINYRGAQLLKVAGGTKAPHARRERMQCGDETDTDSNVDLVIELHHVKVSQDGGVLHCVVPLRHTLDILATPKPKSNKKVT